MQHSEIGRLEQLTVAGESRRRFGGGRPECTIFVFEQAAETETEHVLTSEL